MLQAEKIFTQGLESLAVQFVVVPASVPAIPHHPGLLERLQMKREAGLAHVEFVRQLTDTPLALGQEVDDLQSSLVGQGMTASGQLLNCERG